MNPHNDDWEFGHSSLHNEPSAGSPLDPLERLYSAGRAWIHPSNPNPADLQDDDLMAVWLDVPVFPGTVKRYYPFGQQALLASAAFTDPRLCLVAMLFSVPEGIYGRLASPILMQLAPGSSQVYRRYLTRLRRSLFAREHMGHMGQLRRLELEFVAQREAALWNAAYDSLVLQGRVTPEMDEHSASAFILARAECRRLRTRSAQEGDFGCKAIVEDHVDQLFGFGSFSREHLEELLKERLSHLRRKIALMPMDDDFDPDLLMQFDRFELAEDELAYRPVEPGEFDASSVIAGPPNDPADVGPISPDNGEARIDWEAQKREFPELAGVINLLQEGKEDADRRAQELIQWRIGRTAKAKRDQAP